MFEVNIHNIQSNSTNHKHVTSNYQIKLDLPLERLLFELRSPYIENPTIFCPNPLRYAERLQVVSLYGILTEKIKEVLPKNS